MIKQVENQRIKCIEWSEDDFKKRPLSVLSEISFYNGWINLRRDGNGD